MPDEVGLYPSVNTLYLNYDWSNEQRPSQCNGNIDASDDDNETLSSNWYLIKPGSACDRQHNELNDVNATSRQLFRFIMLFKEDQIHSGLSYNIYFSSSHVVK